MRLQIRENLLTARQSSAALCISLLVCQLHLAAQPQAEPPGIELVALKGDNATHMVNYHRHERPAVMVRVDGKPAKGVTVTFQLPESGPGGTFLVTQGGSPHKLKTLQVVTDSRGRAEAKGFEPNKELGDYVVQVAASQGDRKAALELRQKNVFSEVVKAQNRQARNNFIYYVAVVGGVLVACIVLATRVRN